jgi:predicted nucleic acid-binding protein
MNECLERKVKVGFTRKARLIFDEVEQVCAEMIRQGWRLSDSCIEDGLEYLHLFFEREAL